MTCTDLIAEIASEAADVGRLAQAAKDRFLTSPPSAHECRRAHALWLVLQRTHDTLAAVVTAAENRKPKPAAEAGKEKAHVPASPR